MIIGCTDPISEISTPALTLVPTAIPTSMTVVSRPMAIPLIGKASIPTQSSSKNEVQKIMMIDIPKDGGQLIVEVINNDKCGSGPWKFRGGERTFYRQ